MKAYVVTLTCGRCGADLEPTAEGKPTDGGSQIRSVCRCPECGTQWVVQVTLAATHVPSQTPADQRRTLEQARQRRGQRTTTTAQPRAPRERTAVS